MIQTQDLELLYMKLVQIESFIEILKPILEKELDIRNPKKKVWIIKK